MLDQGTGWFEAHFIRTKNDESYCAPMYVLLHTYVVQEVGYDKLHM